MTFLSDRLKGLETQIIAFEDAMTALGNDGIQSYTLDTGQTVQKVTKLDVEWMTSTLDALYNKYTTLQARVNRSGTSIGGASW